MEPYVGCTVKQLPAEDRLEAARTAIKINPNNAPRLEGLAAMGVELSPAHIAVTTAKYWGTGGVHLSVGFLTPATAALQDRIVSHMNAWGKFANVAFKITGGDPAQADVRISLQGDGYWSYLGTDVLHIPKGQPTMNLQDFSMSTPESEYHRVVRHETGHTLGAPHEHLRKEIVARLDPQKTIAYFMQTQGWSAADVQQQVLTPISEASLVGATPHAETDSIMCYALPGLITLDGVAIPGGIDITADDGKYVGLLYPLAVTPPPPPPPTSGVDRVQLLDASGHVVQTLYNKAPHDAMLVEIRNRLNELTKLVTE